MNSPTFVLVPLNQDRTDEVGNVYPERGRVVAKNFAQNRDISEGLYGSLRGEFPENCPYFNTASKAWLAIRVECYEPVILIDKDSSAVKFRSGTIAFEGDLSECRNFIREHSQNP